MSLLPIVFHPAYEAALPEGHRFPMRKYGRLAEVLLEKGLTPRGFVEPDEAPAELIALAHDRAYVDQVFACSVAPDRIAGQLQLGASRADGGRRHVASGAAGA